MCSVGGDLPPTSVETFTAFGTTANIVGPACTLHPAPRPTGALSRKMAIVPGQLTSTPAIRPVTQLCPDGFVHKRRVLLFWLSTYAQCDHFILLSSSGVLPFKVGHDPHMFVCYSN